MIFGAHVGIAGGLMTAVKQARRLKIQALQIFSSSPRMWLGPSRAQGELDEFNKAIAKASPKAKDTVVLTVGTKSKGHASF